MHPDDIYKTAFVVSDRALYEWVCMPFGLRNSSSSFQRMMHKVLKGLEDVVEVYIDDIVTHSLFLQITYNTS